MGQDDTLVWEASWHDCVREGDGGRQLDQGNVVTAKVQIINEDKTKHGTCYINILLHPLRLFRIFQLSSLGLIR